MPDDAFAVVMVVGMAAHTAAAALVDGFDAVFEDVHAQVDAGMVGVCEIGSKCLAFFTVCLTCLRGR